MKNTKNIIRWLFMYGVYWFITAIACDGLYEAGIEIDNGVEDIIRIFLPVVLVVITALTFKFSKKKNGDEVIENSEESMPVVDAAMKVFGIIFAGFFIALLIIHIYMLIAMQ